MELKTHKDNFLSKQREEFLDNSTGKTILIRTRFN
jgi:hypothetical protein